MQFKILSSGSQGNAVLFDDTVLLDTGISFKKLPAGIKAVLLTHIHSDHFNKTTIRKLHISDSLINFVCGEFLKDNLIEIGIPENNIKIVDAGKQYKIAGFTFSPVALYHDVPNIGYRLLKDGHKHLHCTDTFSMDGITAKDYDSATLEANHCIDAALKIIEEKKALGEFCHLGRAIKTHLSAQKSVQFIKDNNIKKYTPVHVGNSTRKQIENYFTHTLTIE